MRFAVSYWHKSHDTDNMLRPYEQGEKLELAWTGVVELTETDQRFSVPLHSEDQAVAVDAVYQWAAECLWDMHNLDIRPTGQYVCSMSVGDVAEVTILDSGHLAGKTRWFGAENIGFRRISRPSNLDVDRFSGDRATVVF